MKNANVCRRHFLLLNVTTIASAALLAKVPAALAADNPVQETDPPAQSLGYRADASHVDKTKYPAYVAGQNCADCALYQGQANSSAGPCPIFGGKTVSAAGWCSAYSKKG